MGGSNSPMAVLFPSWGIVAKTGVCVCLWNSVPRRTDIFLRLAWPIASFPQPVTNSSYRGSLQAVGALAEFRCLTYAYNAVKAFQEWFSHGNGRRWREQVKGASSERKQTARAACSFPKVAGRERRRECF